MKKILFTLLSALALFSSCSSDSDPILGDNASSGNDNEPKYTVNFDIKSDAFEVDKTPLIKSTTEPGLFQYIIYNEDGSVYSDSVYRGKYSFSEVTYDDKISLEVNLPVGNYHIAFYYYYRGEEYPINASNYFTDYFIPLSANFGIYYQVIDLTVSATQNNDVETVVLKRMWSGFELTLNGFKSLKVPTGANAMRVSFTKAYYGFSISSKLGSIDLPSNQYRFSPADHSSNTNSPIIMLTPDMCDSQVGVFWISEGAEKEMELSFEYVNYNADTKTVEVIATQIVALNEKFENGNNYRISGTVPSYNDSSSGQSMNIILGEFNKEDVVIEF